MKIFRVMLGLLMLSAVAYAIYYINTNGTEEILYEDVIVTVRDLELGEKIDTATMLTTEPMDPASVIPGRLKDMKSLEGLEVKQFIPEGGQLRAEFFDNNKTILGKTEDGDDLTIFKIPEEYIYMNSFPQSLRRQDKIQIYPIALDNVTQEDVPILVTTVEYVKDSSSREVVDSNQDLRYNGSAVITSIEIQASIKQINLLENYYKNHYKFVIVYR